MADGGTHSFWRTQGALGLVVAVLAFAGVVIPLVVDRDGGEPEPRQAPTPTPTPTHTPTATATAAETTAPPPETELLGRSLFDVSASSTLPPDADGNRYDAELSKDGDTRTAWAEDVDGAGVGESLEFTFGSPVTLRGVELVNGYAKNRGLYRRNGRVSQVRVVTARGSRRSALREGRMDFQPADVPAGRTDFVQIVIDGVFGGERHDDTLISEVRFRVEP